MAQSDAPRRWPQASRKANGALRSLSNVVANNHEHLQRIQMTVERLHHCKAAYTATIHVHEVFQGQTAWEGDVEAFTLSGHPKATKACGWSEGTGNKERFFAVLELPPIKSAQDAVRALIVADAKGKK